MSRNQFYKDYLQSESWQIKRRQVLRRDKRCRICGSNNVQLHIHHLSYKNLGNEPLEDLVTLCYACHSDIHIWPEMVNEIQPIQEMSYKSYQPSKKTPNISCGCLIFIILFLCSLVDFLRNSIISDPILTIFSIISIMYCIYKSKK